MAYSDFSLTKVKKELNMQEIITSLSKHDFINLLKLAIKEVKEEETPLQKNLAKVGKWIAYGCLAIVVIIVALQLIMGSGHTLLEMFIWGVSLAVAAVPEALPVVVVIPLLQFAPLT